MASQLMDPEAFQEMLLQTRQDPTIEEMVTVDLVDGRHMELYSKPQIVDGEVVGRVWSWRDITERRRFESALIRLANYDSLTGLMNRRKIQEELEACMSGTGRARGALLLLDLDGFKEVNDTFGHQAGDEVLLQVGRVLADSDVGDLIGRFGGDEFAILLPGFTPAEAMQAAERILHHLSDHTYVAGGGKVALTGSMGVAFYPGHARTSDELLSAADLALYEAKSQNNSSLHVYSSRLQRNSRLQRRGDWQTQLGNAISNGKGKLYAEKTSPLQDKLAPIYRLTIRLTGPRPNILSSRDLGARAQQLGLTLALDRWLLRETVSLARRPSFIATAAGLSFDLSVHSLAHPDVVRGLLDLSALRAAHDSPLVLELTDLESIAVAGSAIATLRSAGYRFEVPERDRRKLAKIMAALPVDYLRLDSSIVQDLDANLGVLPLIEGALHTARRLGAVSVADGVPDRDILSMLRDLGLEYARGPAISPARSANSVFRIAGRGLQAA
jgi:diguanylate cyclase (GGDEF)-like protein